MIPLRARYKTLGRKKDLHSWTTVRPYGIQARKLSAYAGSSTDDVGGEVDYDLQGSLAADSEYQALVAMLGVGDFKDFHAG